MHLILLFVGFALTLCSDVYVPQYHFVDLKRSWTKAQNHCREKFSDLATFSSMEDLGKLPVPIPQGEVMWFGLNDDPNSWKNGFTNDSNSWRWSASGEWILPTYQNWLLGQPDNFVGVEACVQNGHGTWVDSNCEEKRHFVCFDGPLNNKTYHLITEQKTWTDARDYCRAHHTDLAMIQSLEEDSRFMLEQSGQIVWIGMYREPWRWSDGSTSTFRHWRHGEPSNDYETQHCGAIDENLTWDDNYCSNEFRFFCQKNLKVTKIVKVKFQTSADLSDPRSQSFLLQKLEDELMKNTGSIKLKWKSEPRKERIKEEYKDCNKEF